MSTVMMYCSNDHMTTNCCAPPKKAVLKSSQVHFAETVEQQSCNRARRQQLYQNMFLSTLICREEC